MKMILALNPINRNSFSLSLLKSRSLRRLRIWSSIGFSSCVSIDNYRNNICFIQSINRLFDRKDIRTGCRDWAHTCAPPLRRCAKRFLSISPIISRSLTSMAYNIDRRGQHNSTEFRIYYRNSSGDPISPWHDIPIFADQSNRIYNMVVEIPRWTNAKMEISTKEPMNPIKQDIKKGALRYVRNCFPHKGYIWNYGAIPQTWENPKHLDEATGCKGDNDPIDIIEIGSKVAKRGQVLRVKVLGVMALIDEGETDWKVIAIDVEDPMADQLNDIQDVEMLKPGLIRATYEWFKIYKIPDGKPPNEFAFNGEPKNREFTEKIINETHRYWKELVANNADATDLVLKNTELKDKHTIDKQMASTVINERKESANLDPLPIPDQMAIDHWHYITLP